MAIRFPISSRITNTPHRDRCRAECTRDAIFLLQVRRIRRLSADIEGLARCDCDTLTVTEPEEVPDWVKKFAEAGSDGDWYVPISDDFIMACIGNEDSRGNPLAVDWWETESVWLDRDEAEIFASQKAHRWPYGWRVYSVCAEGALAKILKRQDGE